MGTIIDRESGPKTQADCDRFARITVVLSDPHEGGNVGAVCRAMKSMGFSRLVVAGDSCFSDSEARRLAVHAEDVLTRAERVESLAEAVRESALVVGVTRRQGQKRKSLYFTPEQCAEKICSMGGSEVSLVFGNETSGLTDNQLLLCHVALTISTSSECPSLNLSHAVQVVLYELRKALDVSGADERRPLLARDELTELVGSIIDSIHSAGMATQDGPQGMRIFLRDILARSSLSTGEARRLDALFKKLCGIARRRSGQEGRSS